GSPASPTVLVGSADGGRTWARITDLGTGRIFAIHAHGGGKAPRVYVIGETGVYESDGTASRNLPAPKGATFTSGSFGRDPRSGVVFAYATTPLTPGPDGVAGGIHVSEDAGHTWRRVNGSLLAGVR